MKGKTRLGKDNIFARTTTSPADKGAVKPKGPDWPSVENKLTVILPPEQVAGLDRLGADIRVATGWKVRRTEIIRALVTGLLESGLDLTAADEAELAEAIRKRLKA